MVSKISRNAWSQYETLLPKDLEVGAPMFPKTLPRQGQVIGPFDYILPDVLLADLKVWLRKRGERHLFYFLTEAATGEHTDFEIGVEELDAKALADINKGGENLIVGHDFTWALFVDHEGVLHVAGPRELFSILQNFDNF